MSYYKSKGKHFGAFKVGHFNGLLVCTIGYEKSSNGFDNMCVHIQKKKQDAPLT